MLEMKAVRAIERDFAGASPDLEFTGERMVPGKVPEPLFREHEARYVFAGQFVAGKVVLDVACGAGIGTSYLLKAGAQACIGLDIDASAVAYAKAAYSKCNFVVSEATDLKLPDCSIDVVVSFETIEHVHDHQRLLLEFERVIKPGGILVCSSPNRALYRWQGKNPFHVHELKIEEFAELMRTHFVDVRLFSQCVQNSPLYAARKLAGRGLARLRLKGLMRSMAGLQMPVVSVNHEFSGEASQLAEEVRPYRKSFLAQPLYVIGVARKAYADVRQPVISHRVNL